MTAIFSEITPEQVEQNPFQALGKEWALVTAGDSENYNTMTVAWGALGVMWKKNICMTVIRPTRYTYKFTEESNYFTVSFFNEKHRDILQFCGTKSGRDTDKIKETGLTPDFSEESTVFFKEADLVYVCEKIYFDDFNPDHFLSPEIIKSYPDKDFHRMYFGEIIKVLKK